MITEPAGGVLPLCGTPLFVPQNGAQGCASSGTKNRQLFYPDPTQSCQAVI